MQAGTAMVPPPPLRLPRCKRQPPPGCGGLGEAPRFNPRTPAPLFIRPAPSPSSSIFPDALATAARFAELNLGNIAFVDGGGVGTELILP